MIETRCRQDVREASWLCSSRDSHAFGISRRLPLLTICLPYETA